MLRQKPDPAPGCDALIVQGTAIAAALDPEQYRQTVPVITPLYEKDGYLCASAVTENGIVTQRAVTMNSSYAYKTAGELESFFISGVRCAIAVDVDALRPEIFRCFALMGVKLVFCPRWIEPSRYHEDYVLFGPWSNAQANNLFVVDANNVESNVICPCGLTWDHTGFLARGRTEDTSVELPIERFYEGQRSFPVFQSMNRELNHAYFSGKKP